MNKFKRKIKKADLILSADWHLRPDTPICRTDNFWDAQEKKIDFILKLSKKHDCPILVAGDFGHKPQWKNWVLEWAINKFKDYNIVSIAGQHDLPGHRLADWDKSGIGVLHAAKAINFIQDPEWIDDILAYPFSWGQEIEKPDKNEQTDICVVHQMITNNDKKLWPGEDAPRANSLLKQFPEYNLILSGDNHIPFIEFYKNRLLVNPGSIMRSTAAQINHKPRVYLYYSSTNSIEAVYLPIEDGVVSQDHIKIKDDETARYESLVKNLKEDCDIDLSFENNIDKYLKKFRVEKAVKNKILECVK